MICQSSYNVIAVVLFIRCCTEENGDELEISSSADFANSDISFGGMCNFWSNFDMHG